MKNSRRLLVFIAATLTSGLVLNACSLTTADRSDELGSVSVALMGAGGVTISTVGYSIMGPNAFSKTGAIDVSASSTISSTIGGLPAGSGFTITLSASSTNNSETCSGTAGFTVLAHQTASVAVPIECREGPKTGSVLVNGVINVCPQIDGLTATPTEIFVGSSVALVATAHDTDGGPSVLTYAWTASSGALADAASASTRFTCTSPGTATIGLVVSDGDAGCNDTSSVTVTCTPLTASNSCRLGNGAGAVQHVIYLQFDNTHLNRDRPNVASDLEQMPHLLNFIRGNGTMMANDHTILISHTAGGFLTSFTGVYPDRHGQTVTNSYERTTPTGGFTFPSSFAYWTDPVSATVPVPNMVAADGSNAPAPWVAYTRAGCDFGAVAGANIVLENTGTSASGDVFKVFGPGSPQFVETTTDAASGQSAATKAIPQADFVGFGIHCAQGSARCAAGEADLLPGEPGGYTGFKGLFGAQQVHPAIGGTAEVPLIDMLGNPIVDPFGNAGFPGFDGMSAAVSLRYVATMQEQGIPVTYAYISDAHDFHGVAGNTHIAMGPGQGNTAATPLGYEAQLAQYDQAFASFFTELAAHGIDKSNTLFIITVDEGDHFAGGTPSPASCDGVTTPCDWTGQIGEINANIDTLVQHQFPSLFSSFLASTGANTFTVHGDDAPTFYLAKKGVGALGQTDPDTRTFERTIAGVTGAVASPWTGVTEPLMQFMADQTGMKAMHMFTAGDPVRNPTFAFFANPDYFITDFPTSTCETCVPTTGSTFAWNHGDVQKEIGQTWVGYVGPGVASQPDQTIWSDHTDVKSTINALLGLRDSYRHDGRVATEALVAAAVPPAITGERAAVESLGAYYKQVNAPFGQFATDMLIASTKALQGADMGDAIYTSKEASIASLTTQRDALAAQIRAGLDEAQFASQPIDALQIASWVSQAQTLLNAADALASAP